MRCGLVQKEKIPVSHQANRTEPELESENIFDPMAPLPTAHSGGVGGGVSVAKVIRQRKR
jgi:hypothetical protein